MKNVLLIEDEPELYILLRGILEPEGLELDHAGSIAEAGYFLERKRPDLVLLDNRLPDGHGLHFIGALRKQHPGIKIIVISGIDIAVRDYALESGADAFLRKPFTKDSLLSSVRSLLN